MLLRFRNERPDGYGASREGLRSGMEAVDGEYCYHIGMHQRQVRREPRRNSQGVPGDDLCTVAYPYMGAGPTALFAVVTPLLTISEPYLKVVQAPRVPDRDLLIYLTVADSGLSMVSGNKKKAPQI